MKKILLVSSEFPPGPGGIGQHAASLSLALANSGYDIDIYSNIDYADEQSILEYKTNLPTSIKLTPFERDGWRTYINRIRVILKVIKQESYSHFIFTGKFPLWIGGLVKVLYSERIKIDCFIHGSEVNPRNPVIRKITHWALHKADIIWCVSEFTRSLLPHKIRLGKDIRLLPNGIYLDEWPEPNSVKSFTDWKGQPKLLTVGSISRRKGQHRVVKSLPELVKSFPQLHYHIVGMEGDSKDLRNLVSDLNMGNHVTFHGRLKDKEELARAYTTADLLMMLSENQQDGDVEGFGIVVLEANLYGIPVLGAIGCGLEDAIQPGTNGELVDGNNSIQISLNVKRLLEGRNNYRESMKVWVEKHDWVVLSKEFLC